MRENQFRFFRGTCHLFYEDMAEADDLPNSPLAWICGDLHLENFGSFPIDVIFGIAGTGSVGLNRFTFLLKSLNDNGEKYFLLDMKQAAASSLVPFLNISQPSWESEADRIVSVQKRMQNRIPALLSISSFQGQEYIMQELLPTKDSIDFNLLKKRYREMYRVIYSMGVLTASAQLRSSGQRGSATTDDLIRFAGQQDWQRQLITYAATYAGKVKEYYQEFLSVYNVQKGEVLVPPDGTGTNELATA